MADEGSHHSPRSEREAQTRSNIFQDSIARLDNALKCLEQTIHNSPNLANRDRLVTIRQEIMKMIETIRSYNPYDEISIE